MLDTEALTYLYAGALADAGLGVWRPDGPPPTTREVAISYRAMPATPDRVIVLAVYETTDNPVTTLATRRLQVRTRSTPDDRTGVDRLADACFQVLQGLILPGVTWTQRLNIAPMGADQNGRQERADNYQITLDNKEALT